MTVLCSAIVASSGGPLVSRQYVKIDKLRIDALFSRFANLLETAQPTSKRLSLDADGVRFLFVPIGELHAVLITDQLSNIIQDINTLRVLQHTIQDLCQGDYKSESILKNAFKLLFALDELISPSGQHEYVNENDVQEFVKMESPEERFEMLITKAKEQDEIERRRKKGIQLDQEKLKAAAAARAAQRSGVAAG